MVSPMSIGVSQKAKKLYADRLRARLEQDHLNEFVSIEPDSGDFFLGKPLSQAIQASRAVYPDRLAYVIRIGQDVAVDIVWLSWNGGNSCRVG